MKNIFRTVIALVFTIGTIGLSSCSSPIVEDDSRGDIFGKVVNNSGEAEVGSVVEILELQESVRTDENGLFTFPSVSVGDYTLLTKSKNLIPSFHSVVKESGIQLDKEVRLKSASSFGGDGYDFNVGQTHTINGVNIAFNEVMSDSRCAIDATCVWAGSGRVALDLSLNGQNLSIFVDSNDLNDFTSTVEAFGLVIRLNNLNPQPELGATIDPSSYSVNLEID